MHRSPVKQMGSQEGQPVLCRAVLIDFRHSVCSHREGGCRKAHPWTSRPWQWVGNIQEAALPCLLLKCVPTEFLYLQMRIKQNQQ